MSDYSPEEAAVLLATQLAALSRYRYVVEAQRAVLRMEDAGLLEVFAAEVDGIFADISAREVQLMSIRAAAQDAAPSRTEEHVAELHLALDRERARAADAAQSLVKEMAGEAGRVAAEIKAATDRLDGLVRGYGERGSVATATLIDRRG